MKFPAASRNCHPVGTVQVVIVHGGFPIENKGPSLHEDWSIPEKVATPEILLMTSRTFPRPSWNFASISFNMPLSRLEMNSDSFMKSVRHHEHSMSQGETWRAVGISFYVGILI